ATAVACTVVMGPLTLAPSAGPAGTVVMTTASGLKPSPAVYAIHFGKAASTDCMSFTGVLTLGKGPPDTSGNWTNVPITIPSGQKRGPHQVCAMELSPLKGGTGTVHDTFTLT